MNRLWHSCTMKYRPVIKEKRCVNDSERMQPKGLHSRALMSNPRWCELSGEGRAYRTAGGSCWWWQTHSLSGSWPGLNITQIYDTGCFKTICALTAKTTAENMKLACKDILLQKKIIFKWCWVTSPCLLVCWASHLPLVPGVHAGTWYYRVWELCPTALQNARPYMG